MTQRYLKHAKEHSLSSATLETDRTEDLVCTKAAARHLSVSHQTLEKWRSQNRGPRYFKIGNKAVRYKKSDLYAFIEEAV